MRTSAAFAALVVLVASGSGLAHAQWLNYPTPGIPRLADGKPDLDAPPPRLPDGKIDFSGIWTPDFAKTDPAASNRQQPALGEDGALRLATDDGSPIPLLPAAQAAVAARRARNEPSPHDQCLAAGIVDSLLVPAPLRFIHSPGLTVILLEAFSHFRQIYTDGRPLPADMQPSWLGYSIGRWEGNEFVIETAGFNDRGRLDLITPITKSETLHTTERYRRPTFGTLEAQVTIDDPNTFTKVWKTRKFYLRLLADSDLIESICENEKDRAHLKR